MNMSNHRAQLEKAYEEKVLKRLEKTTRLTGLAVFAEVVSATPVDTGRARANWHIDLNTPNVRLVDPSGGETSSGYDGSDKALTVVASYKMNDTIYISNNLPYIKRLNEGHSSQAPASFVESAVQVGNLKAKELAGEI